MSVRWLGAQGASGVGTAISVPVLAAEHKRGDLLLLGIAIQGYVASVLSVVPDGWIVEPGVTVGDQLQLVAMHYVDDPDDEPPVYAFQYGASKSWAAILAGYRAVRRDVLFDPTGHPFGYYAPRGSANDVASSVGDDEVVSGVAGASVPAYARAWFFFSGTHAASTPLLTDIAPFVGVRFRVESAKVSAMLCDVELAVPTDPLAVLTVVSSVVLSGAIGSTRVLEPLVEAADSDDTYKAKLLRKSMPPPYDMSYDEPIPCLLTAIGGSDNAIGGQYGAADFLPDEG